MKHRLLSGRDGGGVNKLGLKLIFWLTFLSFNLLTGAESPVSENRTRVPNRGTDVSKSEFETNLRKNGWNEKLSDDGTANIFTKDNKKYTTRDNAKSTQGPTAEYFKDPSSKTANIKIRLKD
ncbi:hypothetical protein [Leptospira kirschneri]|uniref:hypothetical protein n=1 Tax=Leptospira kirschneri TaxID=29507 RepID=UPI00037C3407|nr:hypothetical protein [Leptospira kirschneri]